MNSEISAKINKSIDAIMRYIDENGLTPPAKLPTKAQLCEICSASQMTVQRAINILRDGGVLKCVRGGGIYLDSLDKAPHGNRVSVVYKKLPDYSRFRLVIAGIRQYAAQHGCGFEQYSCEDNTSIIDSVNRVVSAGGKNIIIMHLDDNDDTSFYAALQQNPALRTVYVDMVPLGMNVNYVASDNFYGGYCATKHLYERGCRNIAFLTVNFTDWMAPARDRLAGYRFALKTNKSTIQKERVLTSFGKISEFVDEMLKTSPLPDGIVALNDIMAVNLEKELLKKGIRVPEDVKIVGFDDLEFSKNAEVPVTTVRQSFKLLGVRAAEMCLNAAPGVHHEYLPVKLIKRQSTGC